MDSPPSYDSTLSSASAQESSTKDQPPSYSAPASLITAANLSTTTTSTSAPSSSSSWEALSDEPFPTLILDGCTIYSASHPSRALYVLSNSPAEAIGKVYGIEKVYYKTRRSDGEVKQSQTKHIYDFTTAFGTSVRTNVQITGQRSSRFTFRKVTLSPGVSSSHFKSSGADVGSNLKVSPALTDARGRLAWKEAEGDGRVLAMETRGTRDGENRMVVMPRLEIVGQSEAAAGAVMRERDLDLLVACWCARVWREAIKDTKEPMSWDRFQRIASTKTSRSEVAMLGGQP